MYIYSFINSFYTFNIALIKNFIYIAIVVDFIQHTNLNLNLLFWKYLFIMFYYFVASKYYFINYNNKFSGICTYNIF